MKYIVAFAIAFTVYLYNSYTEASYVYNPALVECGTIRSGGTICYEGDTIIAYSEPSEWFNCIHELLDYAASEKRLECNIISSDNDVAITSWIKANQHIAMYGYGDLVDIEVLYVKKTD